MLTFSIASGIRSMSALSFGTSLAKSQCMHFSRHASIPKCFMPKSTIITLSSSRTSHGSYSIASELRVASPYLYHTPLIPPSNRFFAARKSLSPSIRGMRTSRFGNRGGYSFNPNSSPAILYIIFGINAVVFGMWWYARDNAMRLGDTRLYRFMIRNFTSGEPNLREGRWWTLLTACFSHQELPHFAFNMLTFVFTAPAVLPIIGAPQFLTLYLGAGLTASLTSLAWPYIVDPILHGERKSIARKRFGLSLGASGSVYAILSTFAMMRPHATFLLFYVIPVPARMCVAGILAWELYSASFPSQGNHIDSVGHVGGLLAGLLFAKMRMRRL